MSTRDKTPIEIRCDEWPICAVPSGMHKDVRAGKLTREQVYTYYVMRVWGRKNGHVWRNREDLAEEIGFKSRKPLKAHLKALVETGWIDRHYEKPDLEHSYPRYVLTLRTQKRTEDTCQCWFRCRCGKPKSQVRSDGTSISSALQGVGSYRTPPGGALQGPPKDEEVQVQAFGEGKGPGDSVKGTGRGVKPEGKNKGGGGNGTEPDEEGLIEKLHARAEAPPAPFTGVDPDATADGYGDVDRYGDAPAPKKRAKRKKGSKVGMRAKHGEPQWPPREDSHGGYDVACKWIEEMRERYPAFAQTEPGGPDVGTASQLLQQVTDPDKLLGVIRLAIWDWLAIQDTIESWYTKNKPEPRPQHILQLLPHLANRLGGGVVSPARRVSAYRERWILGTWRDRTKPRAGKGQTLAEKARAEMRKRKGLAG